MNIKKDILWRVVLSILVMALFGIAIMYSIVKIQYVHGDKWEQMGDSLYVKTRTVPAIRGSIYSEDGNLLATSVPIYRISLDFKVIKQYHRDSFLRLVPLLSKNLAYTLKNGSVVEYETLLKTGYAENDRYLTLISSASFIQAQAILSWPIFHAGRYKGGVIMEERTVRRKPYGTLMARTIGFINENNVGAGIESSFNEELSGINGKMLVRKISGGYRPLEDEIQIRPENGKDIFTTIDVHLQDIVNESLIEGVSKNGAEFGTAILIEVKTGKIKAIANADRTVTGYLERFNHALGTGYEPGSTMKLLSAIATLEEGDYEPEDSIDINHGKLVFSRKDTFTDSGHNHPQKLTYREVFEQSSNVGIIQTTYNTFKSRPADFLEFFDKLKLTTPLNTGIKGEVKPSIIRPDQKIWANSTLPSLAIGYSFTTSPLHMAMLYNAVANDGVMMKPYMISSVGYLGKSEKKYSPETLNKKICSSGNLVIIKSFLEGVVETGTATSLKDLPFKVAGKTGTSKISGGSGGYQAGQYYSSFVGYFPAHNPQYTLLVLVAKPSSGNYYGSTVAVPVFKQIALKVQANTLQKRIEKSKEVQLPAIISGRWTNVKKTIRKLSFEYDNPSVSADVLVKMVRKGDELVMASSASEDGKMPDVVGYGIRHALYVFENKGYKVQFGGYGKIKEQSPKAGTVLRKGQVVYLKLGV